MYCPKCKKRCGDEDVFCDSCGTKLECDKVGSIDLARVFEKLDCPYQVADDGDWFIAVSPEERSDLEATIVFSVKENLGIARIDCCYVGELDEDYILENGIFKVLKFCNEWNKSSVMCSVCFIQEKSAIMIHGSCAIENDASIEFISEVVTNFISKLLEIYQDMHQKFPLKEKEG